MIEPEMSSSSVENEKSRQNCNIDWRAEKPNFIEQLTHFCQEMADVEFVFNRGGEITVCIFLC